MNGMSHDDDVVAGLRAQATRQQEALERIAERCEAVNYPPDLVVDIAALARKGLGPAAPEPAAARSPRQTESHA